MTRSPSVKGRWRPRCASFGPAAALLDARAGRRIPVLRVAGVLREQRAGKLRALAAMGVSPGLAALSNRTLAMEGMSAGLQAAPAGIGLPILAAAAPQRDSYGSFMDLSYPGPHPACVFLMIAHIRPPVKGGQRQDFTRLLLAPGGWACYNKCCDIGRSAVRTYLSDKNVLEGKEDNSNE